MISPDVSLLMTQDTSTETDALTLPETLLPSTVPAVFETRRVLKTSQAVQRHYQQREDLQKLLLSLCANESTITASTLSPEAKSSLETQLVQAVLHQEQNIAVILEGLKSSHAAVRSMCVMVLLRLGAVALPLFEIFQRNLSLQWLEGHPETANAIAFVSEELKLFGLESQVVHPWLDAQIPS